MALENDDREALIIRWRVFIKNYGWKEKRAAYLRCRNIYGKRYLGDYKLYKRRKLYLNMRKESKSCLIMQSKRLQEAKTLIRQSFEEKS